MISKFVIPAWFLFSPFVIVSSFIKPTEERITISVINLRNNKGHVLVSLFKEEDGFPSDTGKAFRKEKVNIMNLKAVISFAPLPPGTYAVAILHDENDDMKMNTTFPGIPKEGYGFSNNVTGTFGPPSYNRASFKHNGTYLTAITIKTRY